MKSLVSVVRVSGTDEPLGGLSFPIGVPVVVYRNKNLFQVGEDFGKFTIQVADGQLVGYSFNGNANTVEETLETANALVNEHIEYAGKSSYSVDYWWAKATCLDMSDGLRKQLNLFDFDDPGVTRDLASTLTEIEPTLTYLNAGMLDFATVIIDAVAPDTDDDFLSPARLGQFKALFASAAL